MTKSDTDPNPGSKLRRKTVPDTPEDVMRFRTGMLPVFLASLVFVGGVTVPKEAHGQVLLALLFGDKISSEKFHLGLEIGFNGSDVTGIEGTKYRRGFALGMIAELRLGERWYLQPELMPFYQAGTKDLPEQTFAPPPEVESIVSGNQIKLQTDYFAIPVILKYGILGDELLLGVGGQLNILKSAEEEFTGTSANGHGLDVDQDVKSLLNSTDAGVVLNVEYKIKGDLRPSIVGRYYHGLSDTIADNPGDAAYNRIFSLMVTMPIGGKAIKEKEERKEQEEEGQS